VATIKNTKKVTTPKIKVEKPRKTQEPKVSKAKVNKSKDKTFYFPDDFKSLPTKQEVEKKKFIAGSIRRSGRGIKKGGICRIVD